MTMWFQGAFQQDPNGLTPDEIARRRAVAQALLGGFGRAQNVGEGAADLMTGIALGIQNRRNNAAETAGKTSAAKAFSSLFQSQSPSSSPEGMSFNDLIGAKSGTSSGISDGGPAVSGSNVKQALLDAIAGKESAGRYDVMYGGGRFSDFIDHPRKAMPIKSGPNAGKTSSAAGRYQFLGKTWDQYRNKLGLPDFSPASQDAAAWALASDVYKGKTGNDLQQALASGDPNTIAGVGKALAGTWTSLPGGIEQGQGANQFVSAYQKALGTPSAVAAINQAAPVQVASLDPSAVMRPAPTPAPKPVQTAQASGGYPPAPMAPSAQQGAPMGGRGPSFQALMQAMQNPWLDDAQRQIIGGMLQRQLAGQEAKPMQVNGSIVDANTGRVIYQGQQTPEDALKLELMRAQIEKAKAEASPDARSALGLQPQYGVDAQGNPVLLQLGKNGEAIQTKMPEGVTLSKEPVKIDAGTSWVLLDPITRQPVGTIPKDISGEAAASARGKEQGTAQAGLPTAEITKNQTIGYIDQLLSDPNLANVTGWQSWLPDVALAATQGGDTLSTRRRIEQLQGSAFLEAYNGLRGGGQITEVEGKQAKEAMARLNTAQTDADYRQALMDFKDAVERGYAKLAARAGQQPTANVTTPAGKRLKFNPATGELE